MLHTNTNPLRCCVEPVSHKEDTFSSLVIVVVVQFLDL